MQLISVKDALTRFMKLDNTEAKVTLYSMKASDSITWFRRGVIKDIRYWDNGCIMLEYEDGDFAYIDCYEVDYISVTNVEVKNS
jgi:hypothetical protein